MPTIFQRDIVVPIETRPPGPIGNHFVVDLDANKVVGTGPYRDLVVTVCLKMPKAPLWFCPIDRVAGWPELNDFELNAIYRNTVGKPFSGGFGRQAVETALREFVRGMPTVPSLTPEMIAEAELKLDYKPVEPQHDKIHAPRQAKTSSPRAPREPGSPANRPASGTATGRVWDIADIEFAKYAPSDLASKALRAAILAAGVAAGINPATVQVQYGKWKASKSSS